MGPALNPRYRVTIRVDDDWTGESLYADTTFVAADEGLADAITESAQDAAASVGREQNGEPPAGPAARAQEGCTMFYQPDEFTADDLDPDYHRDHERGRYFDQDDDQDDDKPDCQLTGESSNVYAIIATVSRALKDAGQRDRALAWVEAAMSQERYCDVLVLASEYVNVR